MNVAIKLDKIAIKMKARHGLLPHVEFDEELLLKARKEGWEVKDRYQTTRKGGYQFVWLLQEKNADEGTIYIGMWFNSVKSENPAESARKIKIEYNPSKTYIPLFLKVYLQKFGCKLDTIQSCDIAFDLEGIRADQIRYKTRGDIMTYGNARDKSTYIRPSANDGRIKIYDKTRERLKAGKPIDKQIARVEITIHEPDFWEANEIVPKDIERLGRITDWLAEIAIPTDFHTLITTLEQKYGKYDPALLHALRNLPQDKQSEVLELMSKQSRTKYRAALLDGDYQPLTIDLIDFWQVTKNLLERAVVFEDLREIQHGVNSPHVHKVKLKDNDEIETTLSKPKIIIQ